ncbi:hypothetical protein CONPUDRAFT_99848 [Coniophora puteana RWD-64-598 SS2]|uniref:Zn(2)-C6 fungal-type domain-containing protein n=1 Tax=Coniophora puteana (strain RWD-64-598) TaxID=741705 RepID=A0A5M3MY80_CONPW|nr:uncharacterized protein CONPUDRAFT_99848 [Coniophora puteana RWD-64-598 SS2]EIW84080.1 hypothetical protein CONPUDRAFT_99848 [Coniophora puteana RWD-64-598 SS2]
MQLPVQQQPPLRVSEMTSRFHQLPKELAQSSLNPTKRPRNGTEFAEHRPTNSQDDGDQGADGKQKIGGACSRCRGLKVKCLFTGNNESCKRCTSANAECIIPGRKKRRPPPKREHLLNQIRDQANQIQQLMQKLEVTNKQGGTSVASPARSPNEILPLTPSSTSELHSPTASTGPVVPGPEVQDWIGKARASFAEFHGLVGKQDDEEGDEEYDGASSDDEVEIVVESSSEEERYATADEDAVDSAKGTGAFQTMARVTRSFRGQKPLKKKNEPEEEVGVANEKFFRNKEPFSNDDTPPNAERVPFILARQIITPQDAENLFQLYFDMMNPSTSLLDRHLHTPHYVYWKSPFLFTVICAVASRYYEEKTHVYHELMRYAQLAAGTALIGDPKNEEMCAAYILLQLYPVPSRRWGDDRSWIYLGLAIRIAQDLNLDRPVTAKPDNERHSRILLNRTRIWMNCFNLDRSTGSQYGKKPIIPNHDYVASHSENWWYSSPYNLEYFDIHTCVYNAELKLMANFWSKIYSDPSHPTGLNKSANFEQIASQTDDEIQQLLAYWMRRLEQTDQTNLLNSFRTGLLKLGFSYARLVALSTGLQHASSKTSFEDNPFLLRCYEAAKYVVEGAVNEVFCTPEQKNFLRHGPEAQCIFISFASAFLVKLLHPKYAMSFNATQRVEIRALVQKAVDLLGSPEVVIDERHFPKLYSRFLTGLLNTPMARVDAPLSPNVGVARRRSARKNKSPSGRPSELDSSSDHPSPGTNYSLSPSPSQSAFLHPGVSDGQQQPQNLDATVSRANQHSVNVVQQSSSTPSLLGGGAPMNTSDFFQPQPPPMFDSDFLDSMDFMADPVWSETTVPGLTWLSQMQTNTSESMNNQSYSGYNSTPFGNAF